MTAKNLLAILVLIVMLTSILGTTLILDNLTENVNTKQGTGQVKLYVTEAKEELPLTGQVTVNIIEKTT